MDLSKAFDKVKHQLLISELYNCGVQGKALTWLASYLSCRKQRVTARNSNLSPTKSCQCGVPQGSVLGPLLFVLYTRHVPGLLNSTGVRCQVYADDIMLHTSSRDVDEISTRLTNAVSTLSKWLHSMGLILNSSKTQVLCITASRFVTPELAVCCDGERLMQTSSAKYLGVIIDEHLNCSLYVDRIHAKVSSKLNAFWIARHCMTLNIAKLFFNVCYFK